MSRDEEDPSDGFPDVGISARFALVLIAILSFAYALIFVVLAGDHLGAPRDQIASLILATGLLVLSYIDLRSGLLPDVLTLPLGGAGLFYAGLIGAYPIASLSGALVGYGLVAGLASLWRRTRGYEGIGLGDAKLLAAIGAWVGVTALPLVLLISSGLGIVAALIGATNASLKPNRLAIPFGPCLAIGAWFAWVTGVILPAF